MGQLSQGSDSGKLELLERIKELESVIYTSFGKLIPDGSDLNNYKTPGKYSCLAQENVQTIINRPIDFAFSLYVEPLGKFFIRQTIKRASITGEDYVRVYNRNSSTWSVWERCDKIQDIRVIGKEFGSYTIKANSTTEVLFDPAIIPSTGYSLISINPLAAYSSNANMIYSRIRTSGSDPSNPNLKGLVFRNLSTSETSGNIYVRWIEIKR